MSENKELMSGAKARPIIPQSMEEAYRLATAVVKSGMAPRGMDTPEKCLVAILQGLEVGMTPMASIQRIAVIGGRATIWGDAAIGLVRASGLLTSIEETLEDDRATCRVKRKGERGWHETTFSIDDAKTAGLWGKQGPWTTHPKRMLQMRARGFVLRDVFADVLGGMYLQEEMEGEEPIDITPPPPPPPTEIIPPPPPPAPKRTVPRDGRPYGGEVVVEEEAEDSLEDLADAVRRVEGI